MLIQSEIPTERGRLLGGTRARRRADPRRLARAAATAAAVASLALAAVLAAATSRPRAAAEARPRARGAAPLSTVDPRELFPSVARPAQRKQRAREVATRGRLRWAPHAGAPWRLAQRDGGSEERLRHARRSLVTGGSCQRPRTVGEPDGLRRRRHRRRLA